MKRLKFYCPFGGKQYPLIAVACATSIVAYLLHSFDISVVISSMIWTPICVLVVCFFIEQRLTPDEQAIVAETEPPMWNPVTPELIEHMRCAEHPDKRKKLFSAIRIPLIVCITAVIGYRLSLFNTVQCFLIILICIIAVIVQLRESELWAQIDETAVYIDVPIHHMYDVKHTKRRRHPALSKQEATEWYVSYLVFYLHDGRYVLKAPAGAGYADIVRIVKFHHRIRWMLL